MKVFLEPTTYYSFEPYDETAFEKYFSPDDEKAMADIAPDVLERWNAAIDLFNDATQEMSDVYYDNRPEETT